MINTSQTNPVMFYNNLRTASLTKFDPRATRYTAAHTLDLYTEVASICRPPIHEIGMSLTKTHTASTGYLVSVYKVFEGDDKEKFERNWLYWTGKNFFRFIDLEKNTNLTTERIFQAISFQFQSLFLLRVSFFCCRIYHFLIKYLFVIDLLLKKTQLSIALMRGIFVFKSPNTY